MLEYRYGRMLSDDKATSYKHILMNTFAYQYDVKSNRLWNCLKMECRCLEYYDIRKLNIPENVILYLERQDKIYSTTISSIFKYIGTLEPWEYIDAYIFDETLKWLIAITHEDLKCLIVGLK